MADGQIVEELNAQLRLPVIAAPMFLVSGPDLVIAAGKAGILGAFPAPNARTIEDLGEWLSRIDGDLRAAGRDRLWAINMIVHSTYNRFDEELDLICRYRPRVVITALGSPRRVVERIHGYGGAVFADVISPDFARKAVDAGADGLILVASGAGGHTGQFSPFAFVEDVRSFWDGPLVLGGAIGTARGIRAAEALGADYAYMGTRFIAARESLVSDDNRQMLVRSAMQDVVSTLAVTGVTANWLRESLERAGFTPDMLETKKKIDFSNLNETKAWKHIWSAGHSVGATRSIQSVGDIVDQLAADYRALINSERWRWPHEFRTAE